jgi:hypothetical protein
VRTCSAKGAGTASAAAAAAAFKKKPRRSTGVLSEGVPRLQAVRSQAGCQIYTGRPASLHCTPSTVAQSIGMEPVYLKM